VLTSYIKDKQQTKVYTNLICYIGSFEILIYLLMVGYAGSMKEWSALVLSLVSLLMLMTANIAFYLNFKKDMLKDKVFQKWLKNHPKFNKYLPVLALIVNFKAIKLVYSGFFGLEPCLA